MAETVTKRLNVSDVITFPYEANKSWVITSSLFDFYGVFVESASRPTASNIIYYTQENLLYKSLLANYYSEFYPSRTLNTSSYYQTNNFNSTLNSNDYATSGSLRLGNQATTYKFFPTSSIVYTINIPTSLYSGKVIPTTFQMNVSGGMIYDDGEYNLRWSGPDVSSSIGTVISQSSYVGNLFYEQGLGVLTEVPVTFLGTSSMYDVKFKNSYVLYEQTMTCVVKDYEFNASYNATLTTETIGYIFQSGSLWTTGSTLPSPYTGSYYVYPDSQVKDFATASYFSPYVSAIGFYNDSNQLLAVAKMSQPVPLSNATDTTFIVKLDW